MALNAAHNSAPEFVGLESFKCFLRRYLQADVENYLQQVK